MRSAFRQFYVFFVERVAPLTLVVIFVLAVWSVSNKFSSNISDLLGYIGVITAIFVSLITLILGIQQRRIDRRPYIGIIKNIISEDFKSAKLVLNNFSKYPARIIEEHQKFFLDNVEEKIETSITKKTVVMPGEEVTVLNLSFSDKDAQEIFNGRKVLKIIYKVRYEDLDGTGKWKFEIEYMSNCGTLGIVNSSAT